MGEMHNSDPVSKELTLHPLLCCMDLVSMPHNGVSGGILVRQIDPLVRYLVFGKEIEIFCDTESTLSCPVSGEIPDLPVCSVSWGDILQ